MSKNFQLLTTAQFAKLCGTTKDTLFHYDKMNILKPYMKGENGYRYYHVSQFNVYDIIEIMQLSGNTLSEISAYLNNKNTDNFIKMMKDNLKKLQTEKKSIETMEKMLIKGISAMESAVTEKLLNPKLCFENEEYLISVPTKTPKLGIHNDNLETLNLLYSYCSDNQLWEELQLGSVMLQDDITNNNFRESFIFTKVHKKVETEYQIIKPKGTYLKYNYKGKSYYSEAYKFAVAYISEHNLQIVGNAYETEILNYFSTSNTDEYVYQVAVQVSS